MTRPPLMSETLAETLHGVARPLGRPLSRQRRLLAGLTAGAVALSVVLASVAPARANDSHDLVKAVATIAVIGVIANEVGKDSDIQQVDHRRDDDDWRDGRARPYPGHDMPRRGGRIPGACAIEIEGRDQRDVVVFTESCMRNFGIERLPRGCARDIRFYGQRDRVYSEVCLRDAGFRFGYPDRGRPERPE